MAEIESYFFQLSITTILSIASDLNLLKGPCWCLPMVKGVKVLSCIKY